MRSWSCCGGVADTSPGIRSTKSRPRQRLHDWSNAKVGNCLHLTDLESKYGTCLRIAAAMLYLGLALGAFVVLGQLGQRIHTVFWIGQWPHMTLFATMFALMVSFLLLTRIRIIRHYRYQDLRTHDDEGKAKRSCNTQFGRLRPMVYVSAFVALIAVGLGVATAVLGLDIAATLLNTCSRDALSSFGDSRAHKMQETSNRLVDFQRKCLEGRGQNNNENVTVTDCPGFEKTFPPPSKQNVDEKENHPSTYVEYLLRLEKYDGCTGFCETAEPLTFGERKQSPVEEKFSCAQSIGHHVRFATLLVSVPSIIIGLALLAVSILLFEYEHL